MSVVKMNSAPAVDQTMEHAAKLLAILVWKLAPNGVRITTDDIARFAAEGLVLFTHGQGDAFVFKMVSPEAAKQIAAHDSATNQGHA